MKVYKNYYITGFYGREASVKENYRLSLVITRHRLLCKSQRLATLSTTLPLDVRTSLAQSAEKSETSDVLFYG